MTVKITGIVRGITWANNEDRLSLSRGLDAASNQGRFDQGESSWKIGRISRPTQGDGAKSSIYLPVIGKALIESKTDSEPTEVPVEQFERVQFYYLADAGYLFFVQPALNSRTITPKTAIELAVSYLLESLRVHNAPVIDFPPILDERTHDWFMRRMLEVAKSGNERLESINVVNLSGSEVPADFAIYNPDPDHESIARRFLPDAFAHTNNLRMSAQSGEDLSHNPLARAALAAGEPTEMRVSKSVAGVAAPERYQYKKKQTGKLTVHSSSDNVDEVMEALTSRLISLALQ